MHDMMQLTRDTGHGHQVAHTPQDQRSAVCFAGHDLGGLLLAPQFSWQALALLLITIWASCRTYYFCFYVLEHYVDPGFRYAGLWDLIWHGMRNRKGG